MEQNELYHYGVPGMRWGKRKSRNKTSTKPKQSNINKKAMIGKTVAITALASIGTLAVGKVVQDKYIFSLVRKAISENLQ